MTKEEWKRIEDWWGTGPGFVEMSIDGHAVSLYNRIDKDKMIVIVLVYVDGYLRSTYSRTDNETGNRFYRRVKKALYSPREMKERARAFGKRNELAQQRYYEYNDCGWRSFKAFKKHITDHNKEISLVSCGWEENGTGYAKGS